MDLGGKEREKGGGGEAASGCLWSFVCVWGGAESKSAGRLYFIQFISPSPTGPSLHPGSLAAVLHLGPDHLLLRQLFQLRLFPFTDATPLTPKSPAFSPPSCPPSPTTLFPAFRIRSLILPPNRGLPPLRRKPLSPSLSSPRTVRIPRR
jgi:hypothetical protein